MIQQSRTWVIAEAGVNHNGSLDAAIALIDAAVHAGADAVKFQTFRAARLVTGAVQRARYQQMATGSTDNQRSMLEQLELSEASFRTLARESARRSIVFMSTPFDEQSATFLVRDLDQRTLKVGSGDLTNGPLLLHLARLGRPIILSTGMATLADVEAALAVLAYGYLRPAGEPVGLSACLDVYPSAEAREALQRNITLLQCTTEYPAEADSINLRAMDTLAAAFGLPVGFSDHSRGIHIPVAAVARGARLIEKHLTLDQAQEGPDHKASLEPEQFRQMVVAIRDVEQALGTGVKAPHVSELANRAVVRRAVVASREIGAGEAFSPDNLVVKRSSTGPAAFDYWPLLGQVARRGYAEDEPIEQ